VSSPASSAPSLEVFGRGLTIQTVQKFRGINSYTSLPQLTPDWAQDVLNVVVAGSGGLSKLRLPVNITPAIGGIVNGPNGFWDFQQANGTRQVLAQFGQSLYYYSNFNPATGQFATATLIETNPLNQGQWSFAEANNILFGTNFTRAQKWTGTNWWLWGIVGPAIVPTLRPPVAGTLSPVTGYIYGYAWKNSVTGHCSNVSGFSASTGPGVNQAYRPISTAPTDPQIDTIVWFRTLDGGGDLFRLAEVNLNTGAVSFNAATVVSDTANLGITDNTPDLSLDQTIRGPLINNPPIVGKYVAVGQGRVFIFNLAGSPQDFIYSGYEQIFFGRPEESFPPNNRIRLSIGAEQIAGGGVLQAGVVAFSNTGRMFMLRGQLEDISLDLPVNFTQYLEELPWTLGCASHLTIQNTPYGLIWLAGDKTVQLFDGSNEPIDISPGIYPYLRRITPGTESTCISAYFNWLERDWYALLAAVDGSQSINRIFFFAFNKSLGSNTIESIEVFVSDLPGSLPAGGTAWIGIVTTSNLQRLLCIGGQGFLQMLPVSSDTVGGLTQDFTINPPTAGNLKAYWRSGYFGSADLPYRSKLFRWLRMISDQDPRAFLATLRYVDDETRTLLNPEISGPNRFLYGSRMGLNRRAKRAAVELNFPDRDVPANIVELQMAFIATADR